MPAYKYYQKMIGAEKSFKRSSINARVRGAEAASLIQERILDGKPVMISRFGANELACILNYYFTKKGLLSNILNPIKGIPYSFRMKKGIISSLETGAGFFPATPGNIEKYCEMSLEDLSEIDILGSWQAQEKFLYHLMNPEHVRVRLRDLSPVTNPQLPWSSALKGKKVLVIHPFEKTIRSQFSKRNLLFVNPQTLPHFQLITLKAVQSIAGNGEHTGFKDWFQALGFMKERINEIDFDVAILGCGAYGMPLAAHIKRRGKQAFHLGGETQILFGIKGKRWEQPSYNYQELFYNEHWIRPLAIDIPENAKKVEDGCYW